MPTPIESSSSSWPSSSASASSSSSSWRNLHFFPLSLFHKCQAVWCVFRSLGSALSGQSNVVLKVLRVLRSVQFWHESWTWHLFVCVCWYPVYVWVYMYVCIWVSLCALNWTQTYGTLIMEMDLILTRKYWISQYFAYLLRSQNDIRIIGYYLTSHYNSNHSTNSKNIPTFQECSIVITKSNL